MNRTLSTLALSTFASTLGAQALEYTFVDLDAGAVSMDTALDINNRGEVIGRNSAFTGPVVRWTEATGTTNLAGVTQSSVPVEINDAGQIVGTFLNAGATGEAFLWENGVVTRFAPSTGNDRSAARGITEAGLIGVASGILGGGGVIVSTATADFFVLVPGMAPQDIPVGGSVSDFNSNLQAVGRFNSGGAFYENGQTIELGIPPGQAGATAATATAINKAGLIIGRRFFSTGFATENEQGIYWTGPDASTGASIPLFESTANALNEFGTIVGGSDQGAFRFEVGGQPQILSDLVQLPPGIDLFEANGINELGQIVGRYRRQDGSFGGFLLNPIELGDSFCVATPNSTGAPARLRAIGSTSASSPSGLRLQAVSTPETTGVFLFGTTQAQTPLGSGFLCLGDPFVLANDFEQSNEISNLSLQVPSSAAGLSVRLQYVFQDTDAGGALTLNASDGLELTLQP